jgi:hydroxyethylthiazole kinase-like uncharacterized protein yjeF
VVCGPGNNGGDGYVCAKVLASRGHRVVCVAVSEPRTDDAKHAAAVWTSAGGEVRNAIAPGERFDLVVDALFGIGLQRPLDGPALSMATWIQSQADLAVPVVALDVPSGLDADSGAWVGGVAGVRAGTTVSFLGAKPGLFTGDGVDACGEIIVDTLGIAPAVTKGVLNGPEAFTSVIRRRDRNTHKGRFGNVAVVGGAAGMVGAALLAARAALRLGAGRVYIDAIGSSMDVDPAMPELMFRRADTLDEPHVTVIGCGLGDSADATARLHAALVSDRACVMDADALNLVAANKLLRDRLGDRTPIRVLTPHPLEAGRLLGIGSAAVQAIRVEAARKLAARFGAIVVLKGAGSVIAAGEQYWVNPTGGPALATPGTGDVLAGMIGALLAQGFDPVPAVLAATWLHGRAADDFGADIGLVASDIAPLAARALARLRQRR